MTETSVRFLCIISLKGQIVRVVQKIANDDSNIVSSLAFKPISICSNKSYAIIE